MSDLVTRLRGSLSLGSVNSIERDGMQMILCERCGKELPDIIYKVGITKGIKRPIVVVYELCEGCAKEAKVLLRQFVKPSRGIKRAE